MNIRDAIFDAGTLEYGKSVPLDVEFVYRPCYLCRANAKRLIQLSQGGSPLYFCELCIEKEILEDYTVKNDTIKPETKWTEYDMIVMEEPDAFGLGGLIKLRKRH